MTGYLGVIQEIVKTCVNAMKLTEKATGTVTSANPLTVKIDTNLPPLSGSALILTSAVIERVAPVEGGSGGTVTVQDGLKVGDRVLMLRVQRGNQFVILSKI